MNTPANPNPKPGNRLGGCGCAVWAAIIIILLAIVTHFLFPQTSETLRSGIFRDSADQHYSRTASAAPASEAGRNRNGTDNASNLPATVTAIIARQIERQRPATVKGHAGHAANPGNNSQPRAPRLPHRRRPSHPGNPPTRPVPGPLRPAARRLLRQLLQPPRRQRHHPRSRPGPRPRRFHRNLC